MLDVKNLAVSYDAITAVIDLSFTVGDGECVALLGPNGAGKSSTLKAVSNLVPHGGTVVLAGTDITRMPADRIARSGLTHVPEGRRLFTELTVHENLQVGCTARRDRSPSYSVDDIYDLFPQLQKLRSTRCWSLSGGEQQMVAIGRALVAAPRLLVLDEPSLGLSPLNVGVVADALLKVKGTTAVLLVEQNTRVALEVADRLYVMSNGAIQMSGTSQEMEDRSTLLDAYLGQRVISE
jgi:branched-chain amino acid transport system ATP-binding protein